MSEQLRCEDLRTLLFEIQRDELSNLKRAGVDEHLRDCRQCRQLVDRTGEMFDSARDDAREFADIDADELFERIHLSLDESGSLDESSPGRSRLDEMFDAARDTGDDEWASFDADALFERIEGQTERRSSNEGPPSHKATPLDAASQNGPQSTSAPEPHDDGANDDATADSRPQRWALVGAAAACAALIGMWAVSTDTLSTDDEHSDHRVATTGDANQNTAKEEAPATPDQPLAQLEPLSTTLSSLRLFGSDDIEYDFDADDESTVELTRGSMLVEFTPEPGAEFSVRAGHHTISVIGTVFSVDIDDDRLQVAVFDGAVEVAAPDGSVQRLESGEFMDGDQRGRLREASYAHVERHIDLDAHRRAIRDQMEAAARLEAQQLPVASRAQQTARDIADARDAGPPEPAVPQGSDEPPSSPDSQDADDIDGGEREHDAGDTEPHYSPRELHGKALHAIQDGEYRRAVDLLTRALDDTAAGERAHADILLELARIHLRNLDEPHRAADYLHRFIDRWPDDPAADAIRRQLCDLDSIDSSDGAICE